MSELPTARVRPRAAKDQLAVAAAHARRGARHVPRIARGFWTCLLCGVAVAYVIACLIEWTSPRRASSEPPRPIHLEGADRLEIVDVPSPTGHGTIRSLARKRVPQPPAAPVPGATLAPAPID